MEWTPTTRPVDALRALRERVQLVENTNDQVLHRLLLSKRAASKTIEREEATMRAILALEKERQALETEKEDQDALIPELLKVAGFVNEFLDQKASRLG